MLLLMLKTNLSFPDYFMIKLNPFLVLIMERSRQRGYLLMSDNSGIIFLCFLSKHLDHSYQLLVKV